MTAEFPNRADTQPPQVQAAVSGFIRILDVSVKRTCPLVFSYQVPIICAYVAAA